MITGTQDDVTRTMMLDDGNVTTATARGNHRAVRSEADLQTLALDQFGEKHMFVGVNNVLRHSRLQDDR